jgi:inorganic pyrophosphatase
MSAPRPRRTSPDSRLVRRASSEPIWRLMGLLFRAHPWHGVAIGEEAPEVVTAFIEIVPTDTVKYEIDKTSGYLRVDRPQKFSNVCPTLYGLIPQTYCAERVAALCVERTGREGIVGDGDPMDVCVLSERPITHGDLQVDAVPIGGLRMIDGDEADDKIIAVLKGDAVFGHLTDVNDLPPTLVDRLRHYFLTYKDVPGESHPKVEITDVYGREEALDVIRRAQEDYHTHFGGLEDLLNVALRG